MFSHSQNKTTPPTSREIPLANSTQNPSSTPQPKSRKRLHPASSSTSEPHPKRINIKDQRRELTRSIVSNLSRDELEKLLVDAALGNVRVMREVIRVNGVKRGEVSASGDDMREERISDDANRSLELLQDVDGCEVPSGDGQGSWGADRVLELEEGSPGSVITVVNVNMDEISSMEDSGPLQFHHVTQRQFEARKAKIMEILRRSSDQGSLS